MLRKESNLALLIWNGSPSIPLNVSPRPGNNEFRRDEGRSHLRTSMGSRGVRSAPRVEHGARDPSNRSVGATHGFARLSDENRDRHIVAIGKAYDPDVIDRNGDA